MLKQVQVDLKLKLFVVNRSVSVHGSHLSLCSRFSSRALLLLGGKPDGWQAMSSDSWGLKLLMRPVLSSSGLTAGHPLQFSASQSNIITRRGIPSSIGVQNLLVSNQHRACVSPFSAEGNCLRQYHLLKSRAFTCLITCLLSLPHHHQRHNSMNSMACISGQCSQTLEGFSCSQVGEEFHSYLSSPYSRSLPPSATHPNLNR